jgi:hypothetical protein
MQFVSAPIMKWKREKSTPKYTRIDEFSELFLNAVYENNFELAKMIIDDGKVDVNIKNNCGDTPLIAACQQTILIIEEEAVKFINYLRKSGSKFNMCSYLGKTDMNYEESNYPRRIMQNLD